MEANRRYTLMCFPQGFDGNILKINIVLIPRNMDPFDPIPTGMPAPVDMAISFADMQPKFEAGIINRLDEFPWSNATAPGRIPIFEPLTVTEATDKAAILKAIAKDFEGRITLTGTDKAEDAIKTNDISRSVKKYLPESYRESFNFTSPRHPNATTDDSYHCALRTDKKPVITAPIMDVSWGQLYAHILRQPLLAKACGMIYETELTMSPGWLEKGGYLFVNLLNDDYNNFQTESLENANGPFIKRYAARIPKLTIGESRPVFAPILFPVMHRKQTDVADPEPQQAPWDEIFAEVNEYNDGYAKIVHANQPVSNNLLQETQDGLHPQKDAGIRMGWDDEQILIWYIRQLAENPSKPNSGERIDAPLGVYGYRVDVQDVTEGAGDYESLNLVKPKATFVINDQSVGNDPNATLELPYQVYPTQINGDPNAAYWLPMYFTNWVGKSLVLKDAEAASVYQNDKALVGKINSGDKNIGLDRMFYEVAATAKLFYGNTYSFRVRMMDISGGGPAVDTEPLHSAPSSNAVVPFKRYVAPGLLRINELETDITDQIILAEQKEFYNEEADNGNIVYNGTPQILIKRPLLGYPAVVFTNKYQLAGQDPVELLRQASIEMAGKKAFGIADPDVNKVEALIEVEMLRMDNQLSITGRENFAPLYTTHRSFTGNFDEAIALQFQFRDAAVLNFENNDRPFGLDGPSLDDLHNQNEILLPTARKIRVTLRAVCEGSASYFGYINDNRNLDSRYGKISRFDFYKESNDESQLFFPKENVPVLQALYLQPDQHFVNKGDTHSFLLKRDLAAIQPDIVQRLAAELNVKSKGLTLVSEKGERIVFGCSNRIRHTLAPDHSSITFASKADLSNHWIGLITYKIPRDWSWDALEDVSFSIGRRKKFHRDPMEDAEDLNYDTITNDSGYAGDIEIKHTVSFEALQPDRFGIINREYTTLVFIDAIEPKTALAKSNMDSSLRFPDEIDVSYKIYPRFKINHANTTGNEPVEVGSLLLPTTVNPSQVPKLVSVGIAFSPYLRNDRYSASEARRKFLWMEFEEPVHDPNDTVFCRVLAVSPDQLISNNHPELLISPAEPALSLDPEFIRAITPDQSDDLAGIGAMQPMEKSTDSDVHYLLPLPPGMNAESASLFGFFTYEFRIGHGHWSDRTENLWSTAQGRYGRPLRVTGIQHPAPTLLCTVNRDQHKVFVNAPFAKAVHNGRNVTADPPRTELWCLLYAQVAQADGKDFRNILLDEKRMDWRRKLNLTVDEQILNIRDYYSFQPLVNSNEFVFDKIKIAEGAKKAIIKDQPKSGLATWNNNEISGIMNLLGLPADMPLSVLVVEVFGNITSLREHITNLHQPGVFDNVNITVSKYQTGRDNEKRVNEHVRHAAAEQQSMLLQDVQHKPLSDELGKFRILRTSPLTEVPFVCCTECGNMA
ncbi:MAG: hypothetical protein H0V30_01015 [Chitinophagaceae bacterium]|nr:hypothetical protein [Chitinophagaceae bacterium]